MSHKYVNSELIDVFATALQYYERIGAIGDIETPDDKVIGIQRYLGDSVFHAKIDSLVSRVHPILESFRAECEKGLLDEIARLHNCAEEEYAANLKERASADALIAELREQLRALQAEKEAAEKQEPVGVVGLSAPFYSLSQYHEATLVNSRPEAMLYKQVDLGTRLYTKPIPSPDTAELIRKAVEEEIDNCARTARANWKYGPEPMEEAIRARSTKEK